MEVKYINNAELYKKAKDEAVAAALEAIGQKAEGYAKLNCPVDTGRLRNSITHATARNKGNEMYSDDQGHSFSGGSAKDTPENESVYIGTNVEYAMKQEISDSLHHNSGQAHFLRDAATTHGDEYKRIAENYLKNAE